MAYKLSDKGGEDFVPAPTGTHLACCCSAVYAGFHKSIYGIKPKLILQFELSDETNESGEPFVVSAFYTASLHKKAKLRMALEAWRGRPFSSLELEGFEITKLLGIPCMVTVAHETKDDKTRAKVTAITSCPKSMAKPVLKRKATYYSVDDPNESTPRSEMPEWIMKICDEHTSQPDNGQKVQDQPEMPHDPSSEEIPF